jgi:hypothetical protein
MGVSGRAFVLALCGAAGFGAPAPERAQPSTASPAHSARPYVFPPPMTCLALVTALVLGLLTARAGANLLPAGGFEADTDADGLADGWYYSGDDGVRVHFALDPGRQGGRCQRLECTYFCPVSPSSHVLVWTPISALEEGHCYLLTFAARGRGLAETPVHVSILAPEPVWTPAGFLSSFTPSRTWRIYRFRFIATKAAGEHLRLQFWFCSTGTLWLDDLALEREEPLPPYFTEVVPACGGKNLIPNSSFELGSIGWGSYAYLHAWGGNLNALVGTIDPSTAAVHRCSLRISLRRDALPIHFSDCWDRGNLLLRQPVWAPLAAHRGWLAVRPGQPYTLSAYLKTDVPHLPVILQLREGEWAEQHTTVQVTPAWRRYSFTCTPRAGQVFVGLGPDLAASPVAAATLWIDGVQLEAGDAPTAYQPRAPMEIGLHPVGGVPIFWLGKPAGFELVAFNATGQRRRVVARCRLSDFHDRSRTFTAALHVPPLQTAVARIPLDTRRTEFYRLALEAEGAAVVSSRPWRAAVLKPYVDDDALFGLNHSYPWPQLMDLAKRAGLVWCRDWSLKWQTVEPEPGHFDFTPADAQLSRLWSHGLRVLGLLAYPATNWSSAAPASVQPRDGPEFAARMIYLPSRLEDFARYVRATAQRYRRRLCALEILNEPLYCPQGVLGHGLGYGLPDYLRLLQVAYQTIKSVHPGLIVVGGVGGGPEVYTRELIEAGGLAYLDALNLHIYPQTLAPEAYLPALHKLRDHMRAHGCLRPLWVTEMGYYADDDPPVEPPPPCYPSPVENEREAALLLTRLSIILLSHGARKLFYHCADCGSINHEVLHGLFFEYQAQPRKMLVAQAALAQLLGPDTRPLGRLPTPAGTYGWGFSSRGRTVVAAWALEADAVLGSLPPGSQILDLLGNQLPGGRRLSEEPVYIVLPGQVPEAVLARLIKPAQRPG